MSRDVELRLRCGALYYLTPVERRAYDQAVGVGYVIWTRTTPAAASAWWRRCEEEDRPYVRLTVRRKLARVEFEMATTTAWHLDAERTAWLRRIVGEHRDGKRTVVARACYACVDALPLPEAHELARRLVALAGRERAATGGARP